ncbi:MAG: TlpA family protein disulfide reductase, partial [Janthinobacterium lividum]
CVAEMPELSALAAHYGPRAHFVGIGVDNAANIAGFLKKVKVDFPIFVAGYGGGDLARALGNNIGGLPYTVVIDAAGQVRYTKLGSVDPRELRRVLDSL